MTTTGKAAFLPAGPGLTTTLPTIALAFPIPDRAGAARGIFLFESDISADSDFSKEITALGQGRRRVLVHRQHRHRHRVEQPRPAGPSASRPGARPGQPGLQPHRRAGRGHRRRPERGLAAGVHPGRRRLRVRPRPAGRPGRHAHRLGSIVFGALLIVVLARRLRAERRERQRAEEMTAAREEFISIVSHELRTPVAGVLGFLQSALDHWDQLDDASRRHAAERACANAQRLQSLTRDVLDTSVAEAGGLSYSWDIVDLRRELESAVTAARDLRPDREPSRCDAGDGAGVGARRSGPHPPGPHEPARERGDQLAGRHRDRGRAAHARAARSRWR